MNQAFPAVRARKGERGLTLVEIVGVVSIIALLFTAVALSVGNLTRANLRAESSKLASNMLAMYSRAVTRNQYYRLVIDFDQNEYWSEMADKRFFISAVKEEDVDESMFAKKDADKARAGQVQILDTTDEPSIHQASTKEVRDALLGHVKLGKGLSFSGMLTTHQRELRKEGKGYLYFFPDGTMERALIYVTDGSLTFTLMSQPYTGRIKVFRGEIKPDSSFDDEDDDE